MKTMTLILFILYCGSIGALAATLSPGSGFTGPTATPARIGSDNETAIARFDVVPFDEFTGTFNVGVVAFHHLGMDRVEFSFENGPWTAVSSMTYNPQTKVVEYWATIDASAVSDGKVEVRAIAYPTSGNPRVLSLILFANHGGTLSHVTVNVDSVSGVDDASRDGLSVGAAWKTIPYTFDRLSTMSNFDGAIIALQKGSYGLNGQTKEVNNTRWITIQPAAGVSISEALIDQSTTAAKRFNTAYVRIRTGIQIPYACYGDTTYKVMFIGSSGGVARQLWISDTFIRGPGFNALSDGWKNGIPSPYFTDVDVSNHGNPTNGGTLYLDGPIVRNVFTHDISNDVFDATNSLIVNTKVRHHRIIPGGPNFFDKCTNANYTSGDQHADIFQLLSSADNTIYYNMDVQDYQAQTLFFQTIPTPLHTNMAVVNCIFIPLETPTSSFFSQMSPGLRHFVMMHTYLAQSLTFRVDSFVNNSAYGTNLYRGNIFKLITGTTLALGELQKIIQFKSNHFLSTTCYGCWAPDASTDFSVGTDIGLDLNNGPSTGSVLLNRIDTLYVPVDQRSLPRTSPTTIGPLVPGVPTPDAIFPPAVVTPPTTFGQPTTSSPSAIQPSTSNTPDQSQISSSSVINIAWIFTVALVLLVLEM